MSWTCWDIACHLDVLIQWETHRNSKFSSGISWIIVIIHLHSGVLEYHRHPRLEWDRFCFRR
ncbi:hypothetical protein [Mucilaginibacter sp. SG564]|uniref:hypothetical protein n=1 Tax=Mucilaginibacter sp. SG564 TaxID=2587022 RepID=UPI0015571C9C|nr:hypothetical protein [Mucilaginibacter sp. SG564]NOW94998.1 hypothetical protein [Mucilaginibacter sp. SG564]